MANEDANTRLFEEMSKHDLEEWLVCEDEVGRIRQTK